MKKIFQYAVFDSRVKTEKIGRKEMWLGHFAGPLCVIILNTILTNYLNVYYTDVIDVSSIWGGLFLSGFPIVVKIIDAFTYVLMGRVVDATVTKQGKARPWILFSAPLLVISTILLFAVPKVSEAVVICWIFLSYNLFYSVAYTAYGTSHTLMVPLSTKDEAERNKLSLFTNTQNMVAGMLIAIVFPCFVIPAIGVNQSAWIWLMTGVALVSFPFILMEYFYTRERVTETEVAANGADAEECTGVREGNGDLMRGQKTLSLKQQLQCCLKSRRWVVLMVYTLVLNLVNLISSASTFYYCNWVLGSYNDGFTQALFFAIGQAPLGIGIFACMPLCKKFGRDNAMIGGFVLATVGMLICILNPHSLPLVLVGQFVKSLGLIPSAFMGAALLGDALDDVEKVSRVRCDGFSSSVLNVICTISAGVALGIFNLGITQLGYQAPVMGAELPVQNNQIVQFLIFAVFGCQLIGYPGIAVLLRLGKKREKKG